MDIDGYENIERSADFKLYSFISEGPKGDLMKFVKFSSFERIPGSHNLALGTNRGGIVDYFETTNNNDGDKILATIVYIARMFSDAHPDQQIYIRGRNEATTRLYRGAINRGYVEICREYLIYGVTYAAVEDNYSFELFVRNKQYDAFLFERRQ